MLKTGNPAATEGCRMELDLFQSLIPRELSVFDLSRGSLKYATCRAVYLTWFRIELIQLKKPFHQQCLSKQLVAIFLTLVAARGDKIKINNRLTKKI